MKNKVDKLDIGKLERTPVDLSKRSNVVRNDVVKKDVYKAKIKNIREYYQLDTKTTFNAEINNAKVEVITILIIIFWNFTLF